ncbi:hypothetical protein ACFW9M_18925 [Streptomyces lydicus]|uniref:hypothetical protein n=1 Tax=Streptomyces lydicus TaxID=47763 RepID=UPI0036D06089
MLDLVAFVAPLAIGLLLVLGTHMPAASAVPSMLTMATLYPAWRAGIENRRQ